MGQQGSKGSASGFGAADPNAPTMRAWVATAPPSPALLKAALASGAAGAGGAGAGNGGGANGGGNISASLLSSLELLTNVPIPEPSQSQVRVRLFTASLNHSDFSRLTDPTLAFPAVLGSDGAGVVDKVGDAAVAADHKIAVGDRVFFRLETASGAGTLAEYCVVELQTLTRLDPATTAKEQPAPIVAAAADAAGASDASTPSAAAATVGTIATTTSAAPATAPPPLISFAEAATLPSAAWTAFIALFDKLKVERGRVIFIDGAAGGVGSYAVQMSKMMGLFVIGTCSTYNVEYLKSLGVDVVIDYVMDDVPTKLREWTQARGVDYLLELVSPAQGQRMAQHIRFGGALCLVGGPLVAPQQLAATAGASASSSSSAAAAASADTLFLNQISVHYVNLNGMHKDAVTWPLLNYLGTQTASLVTSKAIAPCYHEVIPFEQAKEALLQHNSGHARGKIVLRIVDPAAERRAAAAEREREKKKAALAAAAAHVVKEEATSVARPPRIRKPESPAEDSVLVTA